MAIKIKEVLERSCCAPQDLLPYQGGDLPGFVGGVRIKNSRLSFCRHCGQLWHWTRRPGEMDYGWEKCGLEDFR
jgi:hypothetical protein